jgi:hypothetical protein
MVEPDRELARVRTLAKVMDDYLVDPLIGFVLPGVGDLIGSLVGFYVVFVALKRRVSPVIIARMILNLGIDAVLGFLPIIGDAIDLGFKANDRNVKLLEARPVGRAKPSDWLVVVGALAGFVAVIGLLLWGLVALLRAL